MNRKLQAVFVVMAAPFLFAGCNSGDSPSISGPVQSSTTSSRAGEIILSGDGFGTAKIGNPADEVIAYATSVIGPLQEDNKQEDPPCESGADRIVTLPGVSLIFNDDSFSGYRWEEKDQGVSAKGIKVGSTVAELKEAYPALEIEETTLGFEWFADPSDDTTLRGFVSGKADQDVVEAIAAQDICAFR